MNETTKEILTDSGIENWSEPDQQPEEDLDVKVDPNRVKKSNQILMELTKKNRIIDCLKYDQMILNKPLCPPGLENVRFRTLNKF